MKYGYDTCIFCGKEVLAAELEIDAATNNLMCEPCWENEGQPEVYACSDLYYRSKSLGE